MSRHLVMSDFFVADVLPHIEYTDVNYDFLLYGIKSNRNDALHLAAHVGVTSLPSLYVLLRHK